MSAPSLREAARALLAELVDSPMETLEDLNRRGYGIPAACRALEAALDAPPPAVPEVRRVITRLLERHEQMLATMALRDRHIQRQELERLIEQLVSLWERS